MIRFNLRVLILVCFAAGAALADDPVYREKKIKTDPPGRDACIRILAAEPKAIRRPMLQHGRKIALGFKPDEYEELL